MTAEEALRATPVEVKVFDRYLTVARVVSSKSIQEEEVMSSPPSEQPVPMPNRLCSMRVILLLEDMGPTGDPQDEVSGISRQPQACRHAYTPFWCGRAIPLCSFFFGFALVPALPQGTSGLGCAVARCAT